jgi:hypothetical protein
LQPEFGLKFDFIDPHGEALTLHVSVVVAKMVKRGLEAQGTLVKLPLLLVAHGHIVEELQRHILVSLAPVQVHSIEHAMRLLKQQQRIFILVPIQVR